MSGEDNSAIFYFRRTRESVVYGIKSFKDKEIEKLYCSYHKDGGGRFFGRSLKNNKRSLLRWENNDKIPLMGGTFGIWHHNYDKSRSYMYMLRVKGALTDFQYNLWLVKPGFSKVKDLPKDKIKIIKRFTMKKWNDIWIHIIIFQPI